MAPADPGRGSTVTGSVAVLLLPQELLAVTVMFPPAAPAVTLMLVVFCPETSVQPAGTVQRYPLALDTTAVE